MKRVGFSYHNVRYSFSHPLSDISCILPSQLRRETVIFIFNIKITYIKNDMLSGGKFDEPVIILILIFLKT